MARLRAAPAPAAPSSPAQSSPAQSPPARALAPPQSTSNQTFSNQSSPEQNSSQLPFLVLLDPGHGGSDTGALLPGDVPEKTYTLALAARLRALLNAHGIHSVSTRDADATLDNVSRATIANRAQARACILLHATSTGNGVHLFTSSLPASGPPLAANPRRSFLPWQTAQASYGTESLRLESEINTALTGLHIPVLIDRTSMMPLDSLACPAVAVEIAPLDADTPLADLGYQQKIAQALAASLLAWRSDGRLQP